MGGGRLRVMKIHIFLKQKILTTRETWQVDRILSEMDFFQFSNHISLQNSRRRGGGEIAPKKRSIYTGADFFQNNLEVRRSQKADPTSAKKYNDHK